MIETHLEKRLIGFACVSTYGETLAVVERTKQTACEWAMNEVAARG